jgi:hypothetical protein
MPGSFKAEAAQSKHYATGMRTVLFDMGVEKMDSEPGTFSFISDAVKRNETNGNLPEVSLAIRNTSSVAYNAGSETVRFR